MKITTEVTVQDEKFHQFGHAVQEETGRDHVVTIDVTIQQAVNDPLGIVTVNGNGLFAFSV